MPSLSERIALHQSTVDSGLSIPTILTHSHDGGTVHNHERYSMAEMSAPGAEHSHLYRDDWRAPWRDNLTARDETNLR